MTNYGMTGFLVMCVCTAVWLIFDGIMNWKYGIKATISYLLWSNAYKNPVIPMLIGLVVGLFLGHLFWSVCT